MSNKSPIVLPKAKKILQEFGENLKLARLRRQLSAEQVAERAGISRSTLYFIEKGYEGVSIGHYLNVMRVYGLEKDLLSVAMDDILGWKLQDAQILVKKRAPKKIRLDPKK